MSIKEWDINSIKMFSDYFVKNLIFFLKWNDTKKLKIFWCVTWWMMVSLKQKKHKNQFGLYHNIGVVGNYHILSTSFGKTIFVYILLPGYWARLEKNLTRLGFFGLGFWMGFCVFNGLFKILSGFDPKSRVLSGLAF